MQQKQIKYLLLACVAVIWGLVLYRILSSVDNSDSTKPPYNNKAISKLKDSSTYQPYTLLLNYADPFGADDTATIAENTSNISVNELNKSTSISSISIPRPDISFIKYKGVIYNSTTQKKAAIISVNGQDKMIKAGIAIDNIKIQSIKKDRIQVIYQGKEYWIKRQ